MLMKVEVEHQIIACAKAVHLLVKLTHWVDFFYMLTHCKLSGAQIQFHPNFGTIY